MSNKDKKVRVEHQPTIGTHRNIIGTQNLLVFLNPHIHIPVWNLCCTFMFAPIPLPQKKGVLSHSTRLFGDSGHDGLLGLRATLELVRLPGSSKKDVIYIRMCCSNMSQVVCCFDCFVFTCTDFQGVSINIRTFIDTYIKVPQVLMFDFLGFP